MNRRLMKLCVAASGAAMWIACSNSSGPKPTVAGTWHIIVSSLDSGSISPASFDAVVTASGDSFVVSMPALTWSVGPLVFDTLQAIPQFSGTAAWGLEESTKGITTCRAATGLLSPIIFQGQLNAAKDSLTGASVTLAVDTVTVGSSVACKTAASGTFTAHK